MFRVLGIYNFTYDIKYLRHLYLNLRHLKQKELFCCLETKRYAASINDIVNNSNYEHDKG